MVQVIYLPNTYKRAACWHRTPSAHRQSHSESHHLKMPATHTQLLSYFNTVYGRDDTKLDKWQHLCRDIGVPEGRSITQCKKVLLHPVFYVRSPSLTAPFSYYGAGSSTSSTFSRRRERTGHSRSFDRPKHCAITSKMIEARYFHFA